MMAAYPTTTNGDHDAVSSPGPSTGADIGDGGHRYVDHNARAQRVEHGLPPESARSLTAVDRLEAENDVRATLLQAMAGLAVLIGIVVGAYLTLRQVKATREGQVVDLFSKAVEQLASDKVPVRMGGIYSLEQIATNPLVGNVLRGNICVLLATHVRHRAPWPAAEDMTPGIRAGDVGAAMAAISRRYVVVDGTYVELDGTDLRNADFPGRNLSMCSLAGSNLSGANLAGADLHQSTLQGADLRGANLSDANLSAANLKGADLSEAVLDGADLNGATVDNNTTWPADFEHR
jgi:hypothetical protein